jgi:CRP-like cAMP-binding protein
MVKEEGYLSNSYHRPKTSINVTLMKKENFVDYLLDINPLPEELKDGTNRKQIIEFFNQRVSKASYIHGIFLHTADTICDRIYFIHKGILRGFRYDQNKKKEITIFLWNDKALATDANSFLFKRPSDIYIQVLSETVLFSITYNELVDVIQQFPFMEAFLGSLMDCEKIYSNKRFSTLALSAKERLQEMRRIYPQIELMVPKDHLASYLGISRQHLNRLNKAAG